jgi:hypothetical protein
VKKGRMEEDENEITSKGGCLLLRRTYQQGPLPYGRGYEQLRHVYKTAKP